MAYGTIYYLGSVLAEESFCRLGLEVLMDYFCLAAAQAVLL